MTCSAFRSSAHIRQKGRKRGRRTTDDDRDGSGDGDISALHGKRTHGRTGDGREAGAGGREGSEQASKRARERAGDVFIFASCLLRMDGRRDGGTEGGQVEVSSLPSLPIFSCDVISTKMSTQNTKGKEEGTRRKKKRSTMDDGEIISRIRPTRRSELPLDAMERGANL